MSDLVPGSLPSDPERKLYFTVLEQGGRVSFREAVEQDSAAVLRLMELGLLVHHSEDASLTAVNPRTVGERISSELRSAGTRMLVQAEEMPSLLGELTDAYDARPRRVDRSSEVQHVDDFREIRHRILQVESECREETLAAQPGGARPAEHLKQSLERTRGFLAEGRSLRTIYQPGARLDEATVRYAAAVTALGEKIRVLSEPYTRMIVFDRRVAVIPASADNSSAAFIEDPAVVSFLVGVFERDWERAERVAWGAVHHDEVEGAPVHEQVGRLLAQGLTQRTIAGRLGLSERTVAGHISRLRELHDAETLFQLGWQMRGAERTPAP
ncbi:helix-turn-helix transcriptional regulator [Kitasatospora paracochleata]|uniref:DNA-binding transcriptional ArsR family regulator n=1 Tax=Kitasatospora paracochleata TaxID=58354 RepID=A0ABT1J6P4_9ACTN|nr:LuxR C-terminal-related transcriptional regulator [Kitasatospora paracochleata]MCP2313068.1 DNA-binding transcriptional ArsR family regulator [Kitasatospora paracochleata]